MLSGIRKKLGSLAFKLPVFHVISVVILLAVFLALTYFTNTNQAYKSIEQTLEIGPGYMEDVNPADVDLPPSPAVSRPSRS